MSYTKQSNLSGNGTFRDRVRISAYKRAVDIINATSLTLHEAKQIGFCKRVVENPLDMGWIVPMATLVANNTTILSSTTDDGDNTSPDSDIEYVVVSEAFPKFN